MTTFTTPHPATTASRVWASLGLVILLMAACGGTADTSTTTDAAQATTSAPATTATSSTTGQTTTTQSATTAAPETTTPTPTYAVASHGAGAVDPLPGSDGMLGSGCAPGPGALPDGIWFGWVETANSAGISFDLACLASEQSPTATNSNPTLRDVTVTPTVAVHRSDGSTIDYSTYAPTGGPVWVYVNAGTATEIAYPTITVAIDDGTAAWTEATVSLPVGGGCCGEMYSGTASPDEPWPASGLPADGYYGLDVTVDSAANALVLRIMKFVPCAERPEICNPDYFEGDLALDWDDPIWRTVPFDDNLTVQLMGIHLDQAVHPDAVIAAEGSGTAFATLLDENAVAFDTWIQPEIDAGTDFEDIRDLLVGMAATDPGFPYAVSKCCDAEWSPMVYRGPLGLELVEWLYEPNNFLGPSQLEVRDGRPILIMDGGRVAG